MIRECTPQDIDTIESIINEAALAYRGAIPDDCWHEPYMTRAQLQSDLLDLWALERKTILFVTHDISEAIALGDRIVVLSGSPGRIVLERHVDIHRPRDPELIFKAPSFAGHYDAVRACLRGAGSP